MPVEVGTKKGNVKVDTNKIKSDKKAVRDYIQNPNNYKITEEKMTFIMNGKNKIKTFEIKTFNNGLIKRKLLRIE